MTKVDYLNDPNAPQANSLVVAVAAFVQDETGRVLLIQRSDNGLWALPGGAQDLGESTGQATIREVREETGLEIAVTGISGLYSDPGHVIAYGDGEVRQEFSICLRARIVGGALRPSAESVTVRWIEPERLGMLPMHPSMQLRIQHGLDHNRDPYIG